MINYRYTLLFRRQSVTDHTTTLHNRQPNNLKVIHTECKWAKTAGTIEECVAGEGSGHPHEGPIHEAAPARLAAGTPLAELPLRLASVTPLCR